MNKERIAKPKLNLDSNGKIIDEGWVPKFDFVEDGIPTHEKLEELDPYQTQNVPLCRDHAVMKERTDIVDRWINNLKG